MIQLLSGLIYFLFINRAVAIINTRIIKT